MLPSALAAARRLADRFNHKGNFIRAHGNLSDPEQAGYSIVDTVMNLQLLFWAYTITSEAEFYDTACAAARTICNEFIRKDGSSYQVVWFNPQTGEIERKGTLQGYSEDSCWSRGQAWGIYGFGRVYKYTRDPIFKVSAQSMARYFIENLPEDGVAPYDFCDSGSPHVPKDTSAQAIAAAGLISLAELTSSDERTLYFEQAEKLLSPLLETYLVNNKNGQVQTRGLLREGCYFLKEQAGVGSELIYGDYYLLEALMRYLAASLIW
jgi:unsaturated chondroitin disaccharide hydrolase